MRWHFFLLILLTSSPLLINNYFMKLILPLLAIVFSSMSFAPAQEVSVISSYSYLYAQPSFTSEKIMDGEEELLIYHGEKLTVIEEEGDFVLVEYQSNLQGYIYKYYITTNSSQVVYPVFNGNVRIEGAVIYDIDGSPTEYRAHAGQEVYIYGGFNDDGDFTAVQLVLEDGNLYNGLIRTEDLSPDGVSSLLIVGISIIAACVTIILSLVFIKKVKKKK